MANNVVVLTSYHNFSFKRRNSYYFCKRLPTANNNITYVISWNAAISTETYSFFGPKDASYLIRR